MTQRDNFIKDADLDALFAQARDVVQADTVPLSDAFMARVLADADAQQDAMGAGLPAWAQSAPPEVAPQRGSWITSVLDLVGGWRGGAGLATATVMGLAVGLGAPTTVTQLASGSWSSAEVSDTTQTTTQSASYALDDLVPSFYDLAAEG
ncbi:hypothetical protein [Pacificibacter marinus]|uniref:Dihydroorotate dehydrogenase n=1 Tax=Pacificibacter marinus TaxID=658057 RepID=A0A1Y5SM25_9RHOB|nr:hypothetical protein [Pacificibacter marinus]SEK60046.1 hypothetical protein SAMN04488032_10485 [Pacificibacter marinus]SLN42158.1 hypothetical protein PAM7971_01992 [Pacificibacter marinus]